MPYCQQDLLNKKILRAYVKGSQFTGKMHLFVSACLGSQRSDVISEMQGLTQYSLGINIAGVSMAHGFSQSSILYTDQAGEYWILQVHGMESATIQLWVPCPDTRQTFPASSVLSEAYRLHTLKPSVVGGAVTIAATGAQTDIGTPIFNGWHATKQGNEGHIVLISLETVPGEGAYPYARSRLCRFQLSDTGIAFDQSSQTWAEYVAARFGITFSILETSSLWRNSGTKKVWVPDVDNGDMLRVLIFLGSPVAADAVPVYCRYTAEDELKVRRYTYKTGPTKPQKNMNYVFCGETYCDDNAVYPGASFIQEGFHYGSSNSIQNVESFRLSAVRAHWFTNINIASSGCDGWHTGVYYNICTWDLAEYTAWAEQCGVFTPCYSTGTYWVKDYSGTLNFMDSGNSVSPGLDQLFIIPWFNHEGDHDHVLYQEFHSVGTQSYFRNNSRFSAEVACFSAASCLHEACNTISPPENRCDLGDHTCATDDFGSGCGVLDPPFRCWSSIGSGTARPGGPCDSYSPDGCHERETMSGPFDTIPPDDGPTYNPNKSGSGYKFTREIRTYGRHDNGTSRQLLSGAQGTIDFWVDCDTGFTGEQTEIDYGVAFNDNMAEFYGDAALDGDHRAPRIEDEESYNYGDRNGWVTGDRSVTLHYGYPSYVEDGCLVGAT